ncbi:CbtA family protein [Chelatococcus sambhunathii]|uniref:CbtA family protein n=1 Tax=Chelatococcus sambhunathii TaxID=363953 RepID=A0ABU1DFC7_9HYPH|nr:CbtA family protein [Chelatococcus sambhunathii]MDR4306804.1 CbtA family protein [Chelatococcus sambhunathii]
MLNRILSCALAAGLVVGLLATALQLVLVSPLIMKAETYETAAPVTPHGHDHGAGAETHDHGDGWAPRDGAERAAYTALATVAATIGFGLMLVAAATLIAPQGLTVRSGVAFGVAGFAATGLATSLGLAPELPGAAAADLLGRQIWWVTTAAATAAGIALIAYGRPALKALGVALVVAPQVVGAPEAAAPASAAPAELAAAFAAHALVVQALTWVMLGAACGYAWERLGRVSAPGRTAEAGAPLTI